MLQIAICEDECTSLAILQTMLDNYFSEHTFTDANIAAFHSPSELQHVLRMGSRFDIYFLDIYMEEIDGIHLAEFIRRLDIQAKLVFTTASKEHALDAFRVGASQYLVKPVSKNDVVALMDSFTQGLRRSPPTAEINALDGKVKIRLDDVIYVEYYQHGITYHLTKQRTLQSRYLRVPFREAVSNLLSNRSFVQTHKSFVVNLNYVSEFESTLIILKMSNIQIPISKSYRTAAKSSYDDFIDAKQADNCT